MEPGAQFLGGPAGPAAVAVEGMEARDMVVVDAFNGGAIRDTAHAHSVFGTLSTLSMKVRLRAGPHGCGGQMQPCLAPPHCCWQPSTRPLSLMVDGLSQPLPALPQAACERMCANLIQIYGSYARDEPSLQLVMQLLLPINTVGGCLTSCLFDLGV